LFEIRILVKRFKVGISRSEKTIFGPMMDGLFQMSQGLVAVSLNRIRGREGVMHMVGLGRKLERVFEMLDRGNHLASIQVGDADVIVVVRGSQNSTCLLLKLFFGGVKENLRPFLDLRFVGVLCDKLCKTPDRPLELFVVHQLNGGFIGLNRICEMLGPDPGW